MQMRNLLFGDKVIKPRKKYNSARIMVLGFLAVIVIGTVLLSLPISSRSEIPIPLLYALFTSTSAVCVTGLTVVDTALTWSTFGQVVILCLFQIGGLGFMSVTTIFFFIMHRKINLSQRLLIMQSMNLKDVQGVVRLVRHVLIGTLAFEGIGAVILWIRFFPDHGLWKGLGMGVFHSVSAFCNAGFDLMGYKVAFSSLSSYSDDAVITTTVMLLVVIGGIGFFVWEDILRSHRFKKLHLHSKMVLSISLYLIVLGWILFYLSERNNPATIGNMSFPDAVYASLFQSIMPRSGGFSIVDQSALTDVSRMVAMILMFVGGSSGSTAGGIKNVTAGILFLSAIRSLIGKGRLSVFGRTVPTPQIISALSILIMALSACFAGSIAIALIQPELPISGIFFEMVSAVATCGLSHGITPSLAPASMLIIIAFMFFGRIGIMTIGMAAFLRRNDVEKTKHPDTWVMM